MKLYDNGHNYQKNQIIDAKSVGLCSEVTNKTSFCYLIHSGLLLSGELVTYIAPTPWPRVTYPFNMPVVSQLSIRHAVCCITSSTSGIPFSWFLSMSRCA